MTTAVVSDLHLGDTGSLLATPHARRRLVAELAGAEQVVLLGDVLGLREGPANEVLQRARPFLEELGRAQRGGRVVIVPGNHDHQLARPLLDGPQNRWKVSERTPGPAGALARFMDGAELVVAYPGLWLRPDVYATHGHYLDCHMTVPRLECLAAAAMQAVTRPLPEGRLRPEHYEAVLAPIYALAFAGAQANGQGSKVRRRMTRETWRRLKRGRGPRRWLLAGAAAYGALAAANRAGLRRFTADRSLEELGRAGTRAMVEVLDRLGIDADHVIFGHTHRAGRTESSGRCLVNTGSWVYSPGLIGAANGGGPYWPGTCALVGESGPPELRGLLDGLR